MKNDKFIMQYVKRNVKGRNQKVGVVVAVKNDAGQIQYGWGLARVKPSQANPGVGVDKFDVQRGLEISFGRIDAKVDVMKAPVTIRNVIKRNFAARAQKYFRV